MVVDVRAVQVLLEAVDPGEAQVRQVGECSPLSCCQTPCSSGSTREAQEEPQMQLALLVETTPGSMPGFRQVPRFLKMPSYGSVVVREATQEPLQHKPRVAEQRGQLPLPL